MVPVTSFASLEERIAHLNWRRVCNEQQIQGTLRESKQLQARDEFLRVAKNGRQEKSDWMHNVIKDELNKPLPVTTDFYRELTLLERDRHEKTQQTAAKHLTQIQAIQAKIDDREAQNNRKQEFERKKKALFQSNLVN